MKGGIRAKLIVISLVVLTPVLFVGYLSLRTHVSSIAGMSPGARDEALTLVDRSALWVVAVGGVFVFGLSTAAASVASRTARRLAVTARRMAEGGISVVPVSDGEKEFGELGAALEQLARGYSTVLADYGRERDRMRSILSGMREGVLLFDRKKRVALVNPALREMLLLSGDVQGKSPLEVIRHPELVRVLDEAERGEKPALGEMDLGGLKPRRLLVQAVRIPGEEGGLLTVLFDVTHLRRLEALRKDFVANASHELRTPVATILSAAETLDGAASRDPVAAANFVQIILRNAMRLKNLVDDLLDLSRIESQDFKVYMEKVDVRELTRAVLDLYEERATERQIHLRLSPGPPAGAQADRRALEHVLTNLVDNAVKYCGSNSTISVGTETTGEMVRVVVEDDGPGISMEHLPRIFERFYRVDPGRSRSLGGTGLGLSIVKHLVEAMQGRIEVESQPGKGTRFVITLVAADTESLPARITNPPPAATPVTKL